MLRFTDGVKFDTSGRIRPERRRDGWYVVGGGTLIPVADRAEAFRLAKEMREKREQS